MGYQGSRIRSRQKGICTGKQVGEGSTVACAICVNTKRRRKGTEGDLAAPQLKGDGEELPCIEKLTRQPVIHHEHVMLDCSIKKEIDRAA